MRFLRLFFVLSAIAGHMAWVAAQQLPMLPDWVGELTRFVPFYYLLVPLALAVPLAWRLPLGLFWLALLNLAWLLGPTMGLQLNRPEAAAGKPSVRVMTYNIKALSARHKDIGFADIEQEIREHQPDILALQDATSWLPRISNTVPTPAPAAAGMPYVVGLDQLVIASRYPLSHCRTEPVTPHSKLNLVLLCEVALPGKVITVLTVHLVSPREALLASVHEVDTRLGTWHANFAIRKGQAASVARAMERIQGPLIVLGDFNAAEDSHVVRTFKEAGLHDTFADAGWGWGYTYGHALAKNLRGLDFLRIDHILATTDLRATRTQVGGVQASEHSPVIADVSY